MVLDGSPAMPFRQFQSSSNWLWPLLVLSKKIVHLSTKLIRSRAQVYKQNNHCSFQCLTSHCLSRSINNFNWSLPCMCLRDRFPRPAFVLSFQIFPAQLLSLHKRSSRFLVRCPPIRWDCSPSPGGFWRVSWQRCVLLPVLSEHPVQVLYLSGFFQVLHWIHPLRFHRRDALCDSAVGITQYDMLLFFKVIHRQYS